MAKGKDKRGSSARAGGGLTVTQSFGIGVGFLVLLLAVSLPQWMKQQQKHLEQHPEQRQQRSPTSLLLPEQAWARFRERHRLAEPLGATLQRHHSSTPLLLRSVPLANNRTLHALLSGIQYPRIKVHSQARVPFYDPQSAWAVRRPALSPHVSLPPAELGDFPFSSAAPSSTSPGWWHITLTLAGSAGLQLVSLLAPGFFDSLGEQSAAEHRLWLARQGWTVSPHYDVTDNLYLQLRGSKTFLVASPEAARSLALHPSLHPSWRQSQRLELTSMPALRAATEGDPSVRIWEVTLRAGDALFLPAFFLHSVETGADSVSVNAWMPSEGAASASAQMRLVAPWPAGASRQAKLLALGSATGLLFSKAHNVFGCSQADMLDQLRSRHVSLAQQGHWCGGNTEGGDEAACSEQVHPAAAEAATSVVSQAVQTLLDLLQTKVNLPAVRALLFLDWLEEALDAALGPHSSPCSVVRFVDTCM